MTHIWLLFLLMPLTAMASGIDELELFLNEDRKAQPLLPKVEEALMDDFELRYKTQGLGHKNNFELRYEPRFLQADYLKRAESLAQENIAVLKVVDGNRSRYLKAKMLLDAAEFTHAQDHVSDILSQYRRWLSKAEKTMGPASLKYNEMLRAEADWQVKKKLLQRRLRFYMDQLNQWSRGAIHEKNIAKLKGLSLDDIETGLAKSPQKPHSLELKEIELEKMKNKQKMLTSSSWGAVKFFSLGAEYDAVQARTHYDFGVAFDLGTSSHRDLDLESKLAKLSMETAQEAREVAQKSEGQWALLELIERQRARKAETVKLKKNRDLIFAQKGPRSLEAIELGLVAMMDRLQKQEGLYQLRRLYLEHCAKTQDLASLKGAAYVGKFER